MQGWKRRRRLRGHPVPGMGERSSCWAQTPTLPGASLPWNRQGCRKEQSSAHCQGRALSCGSCNLAVIPAGRSGAGWFRLAAGSLWGWEELTPSYRYLPAHRAGSPRWGNSSCPPCRARAAGGSGQPPPLLLSNPKSPPRPHRLQALLRTWLEKALAGTRRSNEPHGGTKPQPLRGAALCQLPPAQPFSQSARSAAKADALPGIGSADASSAFLEAASLHHGPARPLPAARCPPGS